MTKYKAHNPSPEPIVRWINYYGSPVTGHSSEELAEQVNYHTATGSRKALIKVTEHPCGKIEAEVVS